MLPYSLVSVTYGDHIFQTKSHICGMMNLNIIVLAMRQNICSHICPEIMALVLERIFNIISKVKWQKNIYYLSCKLWDKGRLKMGKEFEKLKPIINQEIILKTSKISIIYSLSNCEGS